MGGYLHLEHCFLDQASSKKQLPGVKVCVSNSGLSVVG